MDLTFYTVILLPAGLGCLGFIEPSTIGGHLLFLDTQKTRNHFEKISSVTSFVIVRSVMAGIFGVLIALLGGILINV